jgi:hypothetical protein
MPYPSRHVRSRLGNDHDIPGCLGQVQGIDIRFEYVLLD